MEVDDLCWFDLPAGLVEIHCPECGCVSMVSDWKEASVSCETCGEHDAIECPECYERFDHVWHDELTKANP